VIVVLGTGYPELPKSWIGGQVKRVTLETELFHTFRIPQSYFDTIHATDSESLFYGLKKWSIKVQHQPSLTSVAAVDNLKMSQSRERERVC
jgi:hypothetical protein